MDDVEMSEAGAEAAPEAKMEPEVAPGEKVMMMMTMMMMMMMMMIVMKVMADSGVAATVSVSLHPLVIMNISEHWTR